MMYNICQRITLKIKFRKRELPALLGVEGGHESGQSVLL